MQVVVVVVTAAAEACMWLANNQQEALPWRGNQSIGYSVGEAPRLALLEDPQSGVCLPFEFGQELSPFSLRASGGQTDTPTQALCSTLVERMVIQWNPTLRHLDSSKSYTSSNNYESRN